MRIGLLLAEPEVPLLVPLWRRHPSRDLVRREVLLPIEDMSEANLAWLKDVRSELSSLTGAEADIDGFGGGGRRAARRF